MHQICAILLKNALFGAFNCNFELCGVLPPGVKPTFLDSPGGVLAGKLAPMAILELSKMSQLENHDTAAYIHRIGGLVLHQKMGIGIM